MTNECEFPYGERSLHARPPDGHKWTILKSHYARGLQNPEEAITNSLRTPIGTLPLRQCLRPENKVVIIVTDNTRACPDDKILPPLLAEVETVVPAANIILIVALGLHVALNRGELIEKLGSAIVNRYAVVNHDSTQTVNIGTTSRGNPVEINRRVVEADFRISTGFIEPHFFAGFSGGCKSITPGVASVRTIQANHSFTMVGHPNSRAGILLGNPVYQDIIEQARIAKHNFIVNVLLNEKREITHVVAGDPVAAHARGCDIESGIAGVKVDRQYDICVTTNSGAPLDLDFYQTCKGIENASRITREGGIIIIAAACNTGVGPEAFRCLHAAESSPHAVLRKIKDEGPLGVQWQNQILARVQIKNKIYLVSELEDSQAREMLVVPFPTIEAALQKAVEAMGPNAQIAVIPEGPLVLPFL